MWEPFAAELPDDFYFEAASNSYIPQVALPSPEQSVCSSEYLDASSMRTPSLVNARIRPHLRSKASKQNSYPPHSDQCGGLIRSKVAATCG